jgi:cell division protein FtsL
MKTFIVAALLVAVSAFCVFGQAEQVKKKAKDLKRDIETQQTNQIKGATNAPAKR